MNSPSAPETDRNITAFFDTRDGAEQAIEALTSDGVPRERMLLRAGAARSLAPAGNDKSLLTEVKELVLPSETSDSAVEAVRHEGFLLTIRPDPEAHDPVLSTLKGAGALNVESRTDTWPTWKSDPEAARADDAGAEPEAGL